MHNGGNGNALLEQRGLHKQLSGDGFSTIFINNDQLWNSTPQILKFHFLSGDHARTEEQREKVREAIDEWTWYASVEFEEATAAATSNIRILFDPNDGSWSYVGRQCEKVAVTDATMNLAWLDKSNPSLTTNERAVILHQFGHVLGLLHEHQSPAHGASAISNIGAIIDLYPKTQGWTIQQVYDQVINMYSFSDVSNFSQVDVNSIMHYPQPKELTGLLDDLPYNTKLTDHDKAYIFLQYPSKEIHPKAKEDGWSFQKALDIMGAPEDVQTQVLHLLRADRDSLTGEISPINTRQKIEDWTRSAHASRGLNLGRFRVGSG